MMQDASSSVGLMYNCARVSQIMQDAPDILFSRLIIMEAKGGGSHYRSTISVMVLYHSSDSRVFFYIEE